MANLLGNLLIVWAIFSTFFVVWVMLKYLGVGVAVEEHDHSEVDSRSIECESK